MADVSVLAEPVIMLWPQAWVLGAAMFGAMAVDALWGEPPSRWHPVAWMGQLQNALGCWVAPEQGNHSSPPEVVQWGKGFAAWSLGLVPWLAAACLLQAMLVTQHWAWQCLGLALLLKPMLAWRMLRDESAAVEHALSSSLEAGRERVAWLVSRDVEDLDPPGVRSAAISTLAENLCDSVVAPLFWFAVAGLPGAVIYRWANTADAMWGYLGARGGRVWTHAGHWAARTDDVLNWIPARLTAALLWLVSQPVSMRGLAKQARLTPSPNGGWTMGAMALGVGIALSKPGVYTLHASGRVPAAEDMKRAVTLAGRAVWLATVGLAVAILSIAISKG